MASDRGQGRLPGVGGSTGPGRARRVRRGVDAQIAALRQLDALPPACDGYIAVARTLADAMDEEWAGPDPSSYTVATVAGKLVPVLDVLTGERRDQPGVGLDEELAVLVAAVRDAAGHRPPDDR